MKGLKTKNGYIFSTLITDTLFTYKFKEAILINGVTGTVYEGYLLEIGSDGKCCLFGKEGIGNSVQHDKYKRQEWAGKNYGYAMDMCLTLSELEQFYPHFTEKQVNYIKNLIKKNKIKFLESTL